MSVITLLPDPPTTTDPVNFAARADLFNAALPGFVDEVNDFAAALNNLSTTSTSTTSVSIGTGTKNFTVQTGKSYYVGMSLKLAYDATNWMVGEVISYNSGTGALSVNVVKVTGSGTYIAWVITLGFNSSIGTSQIDDLAVGNPKLADLYINDLTTVVFDPSSDYVAISDGSDGGKKKKSLLPQSAAGEIIDFSGIAAPSGYLVCPLAQTNISRATYAALWAAIHKESTVTISIASPGVVSWNAHPLVNGLPVVLSTTGALPTGLVAGVTYYVVGAATNTFNLSATVGGAAINTTGSQSGVHTAVCAPWGVGDGSTTFGMPWFPADYAAVQSNGANVGSNHVGEVISHNHAGTYYRSDLGGGNHSGGAATFGTSTMPLTGGSSNRAAGSRVLKCVKY